MYIVQRFVLLSLLVLVAACSKGNTSVDQKPVTDGAVPSNFVGVYRGTLTATAKAGPLNETTTDVITITVSADNTIRFEGDDPDEVFVTKVGANGNFNGSLPIKTGDCEGNVDVSGSVDGTAASGDLGGSGKCKGVSVGVSGNFSATK